MPLYTAPSKHFILGASAVAVNNTGNTTENTLATVTVPGGLMGLRGLLRIESLWSYTNSANNKQLRTRFGGLAGTVYHQVTRTTTAVDRDLRSIFNANSLSSQKSFALATVSGSSAAALVTSALNTAVDQDLVFTAQLASAGETITLEAYLVELLLP